MLNFYKPTVQVLNLGLVHFLVLFVYLEIIERIVKPHRAYLRETLTTPSFLTFWLAAEATDGGGNAR